jgi:hypothetical protein
VISPVPVTLNLFLALELVLTFGIGIQYLNYTLLASRSGGLFVSHVGNNSLCAFAFRKKPSIKMERKGNLLP